MGSASLRLGRSSVLAGVRAELVTRFSKEENEVGGQFNVPGSQNKQWIDVDRVDHGF